MDVGSKVKRYVKESAVVNQHSRDLLSVFCERSSSVVFSE